MQFEDDNIEVREILFIKVINQRQFNMFTQSGGMGQSGMHVQQQNQVPTAGMQMQQHGMMSMPSQQVMPQQMSGGMQQQPNLGTIGQQHSLGGVGHPQQMVGIRQPSLGVHTTQQTIMIKTEVGANTAPTMGMVQQRMPVQNPSQSQEGASTAPQTNPQDPIIRFKILLPQLKESLVNLISVARQNFATNATNDNLEKTVDTSLLPRFDKSLEQFYSLCNQIEANLCLANDQISQTLSSIQHTPFSTMKEMQVYPNYIMTVKQQLAYAKDIQNMLLESSNRSLAHTSAAGVMGHRP